MSLDLSILNHRELLELAEKAKAEAEAKREGAMMHARERLTNLAESLGFTIAELFPTASVKPAKKSHGSKSAPKYVSPVDPSQTWTGRGKQPTWYKNAIAGGASPESLRIAA